VSLTVAVDL